MVKDLNTNVKVEEFKSSHLQLKYNLGVKAMWLALGLEFCSPSLGILG
jgi:hypothetical protein